MKTSLIWIAVVSGVAATAVACGSDDPATGGFTTGTGTNTNTTTTGGAVTGTGGGTATTGGTTVGTGGTTVVGTGGTVTGTGGGSTVTPTGDELVNVEGWVGADPLSTADNPSGIQGAWYLYGDNITCNVTTGNPCTAAGCCLNWTTIVDSNYDSWGCGIGMELNSTGGDAPTKQPYSGTATGFNVTIGGTSAPNKIRIGFTQAQDTTGMVSPFYEVAGPGTYTVRFSDATCPSWGATSGCTAAAVASSSYDIQFQVPGGDAAGSGQICITSLKAI